MIACCLFDLDGVIVDTARYHYLAWASLARELGFEFTPEAGEATKGVSRMASLDIVLHAGGLDDRFSPAEKERLAAEKNARYLAYVSAMTPAEVLPGAAAFLRDVRAHGVLTVLGSASKNAGTILDRCGLRPLFERRGRWHRGHASQARSRGFCQRGRGGRCAARKLRSVRGRRRGYRGRSARRYALGGCRRQPSARGGLDAAERIRRIYV